jgi:hypothetical protein
MFCRKHIEGVLVTFEFLCLTACNYIAFRYGIELIFLKNSCRYRNVPADFLSLIIYTVKKPKRKFKVWSATQGTEIFFLCLQ